MRLSDQEVSILLGATLMHWGVPFHSAAKHELNALQQVTADALSDRLVVMRDAHLADMDLAAGEIAVLVHVLANCLEECGTNPVDLRLHLKTSDRRDVDALIGRLTTQLQPTRQDSLH